MRYEIAGGHSIEDVLGAISRGRVVYALESSGNGQYHLVRTASWRPGRHTVGPYRPVEPLKSLVFTPREFLGELWTEARRGPVEERIVIGVKNCDLSALRIHDYVFLRSEPVDPAYAEAREKTLLVSADCTDCLEVCFCPAVGESPYARQGFDINVSTVEDQVLIETGSERGAAALEAAKACLKPATEALVAARDRARERMVRRVTENAAKKGLAPGMDFQKAIAQSFESELWNDFAKDCVECGACNFCCCTCHCFLLVDGATKGCGSARTMQWDSCLFKNFARVAGGANMRPHRAERLLNRFDKKFVYFPAVLQSYACDGCGRCVEACTGKIDLRDVLKRAVDEAHGA